MSEKDQDIRCMFCHAWIDLASDDYEWADLDQLDSPIICGRCLNEGDPANTGLMP